MVTFFGCDENCVHIHASIITRPSSRKNPLFLHTLWSLFSPANVNKWWPPKATLKITNCLLFPHFQYFFEKLLFDETFLRRWPFFFLSTNLFVLNLSSRQKQHLVSSSPFGQAVCGYYFWTKASFPTEVWKPWNEWLVGSFNTNKVFLNTLGKNVLWERKRDFFRSITKSFLHLKFLIFTGNGTRPRAVFTWWWNLPLANCAQCFSNRIKPCL